MFESYFKYGAIFHKDFVKKLIDSLLPERIVYADSLPSTARVSVMSAKNYDVLNIKATYPEHRGKIGVVEEHNILCAGKEITIDGGYSRVYTIPQKEPVQITVSDGKTHITLPQICGYQAFLLDK